MSTMAPGRPSHLTPGWIAASDGFVLVFPAVADNVSFARAVVAAFAARLPFTLDEIEELKLAVSEIVANAVLHAYGEDGGPVWLGARVTDGGLEVVVEDAGRGIPNVAEARRPGVTRLEGEHLGIGFSVAESYVGELTVESSPGAGTCVRMVKRPIQGSANRAPRPDRPG